MGERDDPYELDELLGAYALDALEPDERRRVEEYIAVNPRAAAEVQQHREVATMLAFTGMSAPEDVWTKIAAEIDAEAPAPGPELAKVLSMDQRPTPGRVAPPVAESDDDAEVAPVAPTPLRRRATTWFLGAAAAVSLVVAGVAITTANSSSDDPIADAYAAAIDDPGSRSTELVADDDTASATGLIGADGRGFLDAASLPPLDEDRTYQLWGVLADTGDVVSIGILGNEPGLETFTVAGEIAALAVTIEQAPGVISDGNPDGAFVGTFA
ncbi:MAG: anti-sigma factor [Ilumatobacter sp.]